MTLIFGRNTPDEVIVQLLINAEREDFEELCKRPELSKFCRETPISERVYREKSIKEFPELINFREGAEAITWREFYERIRILFDLKVLYTLTSLADLYCTFEKNLLELNILKSEGLLPSELGAFEATASGNLQTVEWLAQNGILPSREAVNVAKRNGHRHLLAFLEQYGIRPTARILFH
jgi:hypothetical protein